MKPFPNMATRIFYDYCLSSNISITHNIYQLKQHMKMLNAESKKTHPFISSCVQEAINNIDWAFIEREFTNGKQEVSKSTSPD